MAILSIASKNNTDASGSANRKLAPTEFNSVVSSINSLHYYFNVKDYGATGNGSTDDTAAIQAAITAAIAVNGHVIFPYPATYYKVTDTINIVPAGVGAQCWINMEGQGARNTSIVYSGADAKPVFKIVGLKGGYINNIHVKLDAAVNDGQCWDLGGSTASSSTAGFTFNNCQCNLDVGVNNIGWRIGTAFSGTNHDLSQITWQNCLVFGSGAAAGSTGYSIVGTNTLQLAWLSSGSALCDIGVSCTAGGSLFFFGGGMSSQNTDFYLSSSNTFDIIGGRYESGKCFINVPSASSHPNINMVGVQLASYSPTDNRLINFNRTGTLNIIGFKAERNAGDHTAAMIYLGGTTGQGTCSIIGGALRAADPFYTIATSGMWKVNFQAVGRLNSSGQTTSYMTDRVTKVLPTSSAGLTSGMWYSNAGVVTIVP